MPSTLKISVHPGTSSVCSTLQGQGKHSQPMRTDIVSSASAYQLLGEDKMHIPSPACL